MSVLLVLLAVVVLGLVVAVAAGVVGGGLAPARRERPRAELHAPLGRLRERDVARLRLSTAVRGYRMDEVDAVLDRLRAELAARDSPLADADDDADHTWSVPAGGAARPPGRTSSEPDDRPERG